MRFLLCLAACGMWLTLACPAPLDAQTAATPSEPSAGTNDSAYAALRIVARSLGKDALDRVVEITGRDGGPQPYLWRVVLTEGAGGTREVEVAGGKVTTQRTDPRPPSSKATIHLADLNLDSSGAFDATDAQARKVHLRFDAVNYALRTSEASGKPQWTLNLFNKEGSEVGTMRLGANDGNILSIDGRLANAPAPAATPRPVAVVTTTPVPRPRETAAPGRGVVESHTTTTTTTVVAPPPPPPVTPATTTTADEVIVESNTVDQEGGMFTRTGRTLDKTSRNVGETLRRTGARVQRFFTGRGDTDQDAPPPPPTPRDPNFRGD